MVTDWHPIASLPDDRLDGRDILLAEPNILAPAYGGDGIKRNPEAPWFYYIAQWADYVSPSGAWSTTETDRHGDPILLTKTRVAYWADIKPPECYSSSMDDSDPLTFAAKTAGMTDRELVAAWGALPSHEVLDDWGQAVADEMVERGIDF